jgi:A1 cistron-splicing factor AAR2
MDGINTTAAAAHEMTSVLIADAPTTGFEFGIDCMCYETGPQFKGVTGVPAGLHFVYCGVGMSPRQGMFVRLKKNDICVKQWDPVNEGFLAAEDSPIPEGSIAALRAQVAQGQLAANLGPYPLSQWSTWKNLSSFITSLTLLRPGCSPGVLLEASNDETAMATNSTDAYYKLDSHTSGPHYANVFAIENELNISSVENGALLTTRNMDKSEILERMIQHSLGNQFSEVLGELQLSFVLFIFMFSHSSLKQWQLLVHTICCSDAYLTANKSFTCAFIRVLYQQLSFCPPDFFSQEISKDNFLCPALGALFTSLDSIRVRKQEYSYSEGNMDSVDEGSVDSDGQSLLEHRHRLLVFIQKRFGLFSELTFGEGENDTVGRIEHDIKYLDRFHDSMLGEEDLPVLVSVDQIEAPEMDSAGNPSDSFAQQLSAAELLAAKYGWRYPLLYAAMVAADTPEDMIMTSMRVLDCPDSDVELLKEANMFIEFEAQRC